ncbi:MAG TPA: DsbA family protein [Capillimicrobium sp.]|nr:DsbA family protein [Capillimicrobium sp.]
MGAVHVSIYTDPACPYSWAAEPAIRRLMVEFGDTLSITYVMGGLARQFKHPEATLGHWLDAAAVSGMPADPRLWLEAPPRSSYPACLAVKAAAEQGLDAAYLRRAREGFAYERRSLDNADGLIGLARTVPGLDVERFRVDLDSNAIVEAFGRDLDEARTVAPELRGEHPRVSFPSGRFTGPDGAEHWAYDTFDPEAWAAAARAAGAEPSDARPSVLEALRRFGMMAAPEVAAVCGLPGPTAPAELWSLAARWQVQVERLPCGEVFKAAG